MLFTINVIIFANERIQDYEKPKAISSIGSIPILKHIISSFKRLKDEYNFNFIIICYQNEKEIIEDEMERWDNSNIIYIATEYRNMNIQILYRYLSSSFFKSSDYFIISSIYFPFLSESLLSYFIEYYKKKPLILIGNIPYGKNLIPKVKIRNGKGIFSEEGDYHFLYLTIIDEYNFKQIYSIDYPIDELYYRCHYFDVVILPNYYISYDINPYIFKKDLDYLKYKYYENEKKINKIQLKKIWQKIKKIENELKKII